MHILIDLNNYEVTDSFYQRTAARGVICKDGRYLFIHGRYKDVKFPGGGMEQGESLVQTLIREVAEETGYRVIPESIEEWGDVEEKRKGQYQDLMIMDSHYFFCQVEETAGATNLDDYEKDYEYKAEWLTLEEALEDNRQVTDYDACPWVIRDTRVIEELINMKQVNNG